MLFPLNQSSYFLTAIVLSTLLYGAETWTVYKVDDQIFHLCLISHWCKILNVKWLLHVQSELIHPGEI